jgi:hypothetical protein
MNDALLDMFNIDLLLLLLLPIGLMAVANALLGKLKIDDLLLLPKSRVNKAHKAMVRRRLPNCVHTKCRHHMQEATCNHYSALHQSLFLQIAPKIHN